VDVTTIVLATFALLAATDQFRPDKGGEPQPASTVPADAVLPGQ
jgi:hypothetical protein